jgi:hypothetical protein
MPVKGSLRVRRVFPWKDKRIAGSPRTTYTRILNGFGRVKSALTPTLSPEERETIIADQFEYKD